MLISDEVQRAATGTQPTRPVALPSGSPFELSHARRGAVVITVGSRGRELAALVAGRARRVWVVGSGSPPGGADMDRGLGAGNLVYARGGVKRLPLPDRAADRVLSLDAFRRLPDGAIPVALEEVGRVLRTGGELAFVHPMLPPRVQDRVDRRVAVRDPVLPLKLRTVVHAIRSSWLAGHAHIRRRWWRRRLQEAGFGAVRIRPLEGASSAVVARLSRPTRGEH